MFNDIFDGFTGEGDSQFDGKHDFSSDPMQGFEEWAKSQKASDQSGGNMPYPMPYPTMPVGDNTWTDNKSYPMPVGDHAWSGGDMNIWTVPEGGWTSGGNNMMDYGGGGYVDYSSMSPDQMNQMMIESGYTMPTDGSMTPPPGGYPMPTNYTPGALLYILLHLLR